VTNQQWAQPTAFGAAFNPGVFKPVQQPAPAFSQVSFPTAAPAFVTQPAQSSFFNFPQQQANDQEEEEDDGSYVEGQSDPEDEDGDAEVIEEGAVMMEQEEEKEGEGAEDEEDPEEGDEGLAQYCEPEVNAVQELEAEIKEQFNVDEYNKFKLQLEAEEALLRQQQEYLAAQQQ